MCLIYSNIWGNSKLHTGTIDPKILPAPHGPRVPSTFPEAETEDRVDTPMDSPQGAEPEPLVRHQEGGGGAL